MQNSRKRDEEARVVGHTNPASATLSGIIDLFSRKGSIPPLEQGDRLDGKVCVVTGANSGLGKAVATELARRGGHVIMACRSGIPEAGREVAHASGSDRIEMLPVDLADLRSVHDLCDVLAERKLAIDVAVLNAGLMPLRARRTSQGFEVMFGVHFLANRLLVERWLADGVLRGRRERGSQPRVIFVASESHRSSPPIDFEHFGEFVDYGLKSGMAQYAHTKLHMCTLSCELSRRLNPGLEQGEAAEIGVHTLCPGPVASNIARESPALLKPVLGPIMKLFFRSPEVAAEPVVWLACAPAMEGRSGAYLHMMRETQASPLARDEENGRLLWQKSEALLKPHRR